MSGFWIVASILCVLALAILLAPLWSVQRATGRWSPLGLAATAGIVPLALFVYSQVSTYEPQTIGTASNQELEMVRQLAERLDESPNDVEGWQLLGRSYMALGEYSRARTAFMEAWARTSNPDIALKLGLGESMIWTEPASARARAGDLIEEVLEAEPGNQRALWWGGLVAAERGDAATARSRWSTLLASNPPREVAELLQQQLSLLPVAGSSPNAATAPPRQASATPTEDSPTLTLDVSVADGMPLDRLGSNSYVFIFARAPGGGPPIAGVRLPPDALPGTFTLSDANAIIAGRSLAAFPELAIVARISVGGDPIQQPGDLVAETLYRAGEETELSLTIDRVVE